MSTTGISNTERVKEGIRYLKERSLFQTQDIAFASLLLRATTLKAHELSGAIRMLRKYKDNLPETFAEVMFGTDNNKLRVEVFPESNCLSVFGATSETWRKWMYSTFSASDRDWRSKLHCWLIANSPKNLNTLRLAGFEIAPDVVKLINKPTTDILSRYARADDLRPFQRVGVLQIEHWHGRAILADEMGLGKTIQALAYMELHPELEQVLVVCPATLKYNWQREANDWTERPSQVLSGRKVNYPARALRQLGIVIINYDILAAWKNVLKEARFQLVVFDEAHYLSNPKTQRTKAAVAIARSIPRTIAISGTPLKSRPIEIHTAISMVDKELFPSRLRFGMRYCRPKRNRFSGQWDFKGAERTDELFALLKQSVMIRRTKKEVLPELPDKVRTFVPLTMSASAWKKYREIATGIVRDAKGDAQTVPGLAKMEYLKQAVAEGKLPEVIDWVRDFLDNEGKLVLFATHRSIVDALSAKFKKECVTVYGGVPSKTRDTLVQQFQKDPKTKLFIGNIQAAGVGITLTAASAVAFMEFPWNPSDITQAEDRVHRIGQKDCVNVFYLAVSGTIEERIVETLNSKSRVVGQVLDGASSTEKGMLSSLLKDLENGNYM